MHILWTWPVILVAVFTVWACVNVLTGRVVRRRLVHLAYVPVLWLCCLGLWTTNPLLSLCVTLPCGWIILADYLRTRRAKN
jgi:hypothetical protein